MDISIVIPCYNQGQYLQETLDSIAGVTTSYSIEVIVVNDGSTDEVSIQKMIELEAAGYTIIHQPNQGLAAARNNGIVASTGKYILPLDSDNKLHTNALTKAISLLEQGYDIVYGNKQYFGQGEKLIRVGHFNWDRLLRGNYIDACAVYKRSVWENVNGYDGNMPAMGNEDWAFWISAKLAGAQFFYMDEVCFYYRITEQSMRLNTTNPAFELNKQYLIKKHADYFYTFYESNYRKLNYLKNHRIKAAVNLLLGRLGV